MRSLTQIHAVLDHALANDKLVTMNLSSPALCRFFAGSDSAPSTSADATVDILGRVDILFGNGVEASELCSRLGIDTTDHKQVTPAPPRAYIIILIRDSEIIIILGRCLAI